ncbi:MAG: hypothetical protein LLG44_02585 [Chloroflexi bacterium]|nr:hypothetical protein [Chloroflexota bacterium]
MAKGNRKRLPLSIILVIGAALLGLLVEYTVHPMHNLYDLTQDNYNHYLPCRKLPETAEVERLLTEHADTVEQIRQVHPGSTNIEMRTDVCPDHADVVIWYASHDDRLVIEAILGGYTFYGVPARWRNY